MSWKLFSQIISGGLIVIALIQFGMSYKDNEFQNNNLKFSLAILLIVLASLALFSEYKQAKAEKAEQNIIRSVIATLNIKFKWKQEKSDYKVMTDFAGTKIYLQLFSVDQKIKLNFFSTSTELYSSDGSEEATQVISLEIKPTDPILGKITFAELKKITGGFVHMPFFPLTTKRGQPIIQDAAVRFTINSKYEVFVNPYPKDDATIPGKADLTTSLITFDFPVNGQIINWKTEKEK